MEIQFGLKQNDLTKVPASNYYKILFLPKWYPNRADTHHGIFIEKYAIAIAKNCKTAVLYIGADAELKNKIFDTEISVEHNITIVRMYYCNSDWGNNPIGKAVKMFRYFKAAYKGLFPKSLLQ